MMVEPINVAVSIRYGLYSQGRDCVNERSLARSDRSDQCAASESTPI